MKRGTTFLFMGAASVLALLLIFACGHRFLQIFKPTSFTVQYDSVLSSAARKKIHAILSTNITQVPVEEIYAKIVCRVPAVKSVTLYYRGVRHVHVLIQAHVPYALLDGNVPMVLTQDRTKVQVFDYALQAVRDLPIITVESAVHEQLTHDILDSMYTFLQALPASFFTTYQITWHDKTAIDLCALEPNTCSIRAFYATVFDIQLCVALQKIPCVGTTLVDVRYKDQLVVTQVKGKK